jgi:hypothetical protein
MERKYSSSVTTASADQTVSIGGHFPLRIEAQLVGTPPAADEGPVSGQTIVFRVEDTSDSAPKVRHDANAPWATSASAQTNPNGFASVEAMAGTTQGDFKVAIYSWLDPANTAYAALRVGNADLPDQSARVTNIEGQGGNQAALINQFFAEPLRVRVTDKNSQPVEDAVTEFRVVGDHGVVLPDTKSPSQIFVRSQADGWSLPMSAGAGMQPGVYTVIAACHGVSTAFRLAALPATGLHLSTSPTPAPTILVKAEASTKIVLSVLDAQPLRWPFISLTATLLPDGGITFDDGSLIWRGAIPENGEAAAVRGLPLPEGTLKSTLTIVPSLAGGGLGPLAVPLERTASF